MANERNDKPGKPGAFKWIWSGILLIVALMPAFLAISGGSFGVAFYSLPLLVIPALSFRHPFAGGVLGLFGLPPAIILFLILTGFPSKLSTSFYTWFFLAIVGSLSTIIYGIYNWWLRRREQKDEEIRASWPQ